MRKDVRLFHSNDEKHAQKCRPIIMSGDDVAMRCSAAGVLNRNACRRQGCLHGTASVAERNRRSIRLRLKVVGAKVDVVTMAWIGYPMIMTRHLSNSQSRALGISLCDRVTSSSDRIGFHIGYSGKSAFGKSIAQIRF